MKILITGVQGMLGRTLMRRLAGHDLVGIGRAQADLNDWRQVDTIVAAVRPEVVIHAAAMTAVDRCEGEADAAFAANANASANVAHACQRHRARCIAISTDYVFGGDLDRPYHEWDACAPRTVYGQSKWAGEQAIQRHCPDHTILRVAWLYGQGGPSFVHTMRRLAAQPGGPLPVVADQLGNPTSADAVVDRLGLLLDHPLPGIVHATCGGEVSWHGFASEIFVRIGSARLVQPCTTAEFPRPAPRPANSRLDNRVMRLAGLPAMPDWREALQQFLSEYPDG